MLHTNTLKLGGTTLSGRARDHVVLTDRRAEGDEQERGCTSGELMMLAVGSCVVGNLTCLPFSMASISRTSAPKFELRTNRITDSARLPSMFR